MNWFRSKPAADPVDPRDETIERLTQQLGTEKADHAKTRADLEAANRWAASEQRARQRAEGTHNYLTAQLRKAHAVAISLIETERDKAQARLTLVENSNVDALLDELNSVKALLKKADEDNEILTADKADLRTQLTAMETDLGREREDGRAFRQKWARHLNSCPTAEEIDQEDAAKARMR